MESMSNMYRRVRRTASYFFDLFSTFLRCIFERLTPLWPWISWIPGVGHLCRGVLYLASLPWRGESRNEQSENKPSERRYSSDVEEGVIGSRWAPRRPPEIETEDEFTGDEYRVDKADEFYCDYDSTWETEQSESPPNRKTYQTRGHRNYKFSRFENAAKDMWNYRHDYPNLHGTHNFIEQEHDTKPNLSFYLGNTPSVPDDVYIHDFHDNWKGKYGKLEHVHTFIQWLFPLQEPGMNYQAKTLTKQEIQDFLDSKLAKDNLQKSYELMLDFYGIKLKNQKTGEVARAEHWSERFQNLNSHTHNNLRITRILKCLGTLGYGHYQAPLVRFFLEETLVNRELQSVKDSALSYFVFAVHDKQERRKLLRFAYEHYEPKDQFVWCPKKIQMAWSKQEQNQMFCEGQHFK